MTPEVGIALCRSSADASRTVLCGMEIGTRVLWNGRVYYLRGWDPMGVPERRAELEDTQTRAHAVAPLEEVLPFADDGDASEGGV